MCDEILSVWGDQREEEEKKGMSVLTNTVSKLGTDELFNLYNLGMSMQSTVLGLDNDIYDTLPNFKFHCLTILRVSYRIFGREEFRKEGHTFV